MTKVNRRSAVQLFFGFSSFAVSGCTGYIEGTRDSLKVCVEKEGLPPPSKCSVRDTVVEKQPVEETEVYPHSSNYDYADLPLSLGDL